MLFAQAVLWHHFSSAMEIAGLSIGVVGLVGLFESCISAFDRIDAYREYGTASRQLETRFENQRHLLEQCKARLDSSTTKSSPSGQSATSDLDKKREKRIEETLREIHRYLETHDTSSATRPAKASSRRFKLRWATGDKRRLTEVRTKAGSGFCFANG